MAYSGSQRAGFTAYGTTLRKQTWDAKSAAETLTIALPPRDRRIDNLSWGRTTDEVSWSRPVDKLAWKRPVDDLTLEV